MSPEPCTSAIARPGAAQAVAIHLRELPSTALEALVDLVTASGPEALIEAVSTELVARYPKHLRP